jgi:type IV secretion system protein VirB4
LRTAIRTALTQTLNSADYAVWIHTIRRKASLAPPGEYPQDFSRMLNLAWRNANDWDHQFVNEVYITIVKEGESGKVTKPADFVRGMFPAAERKHRWKFIEKNTETLTEATDQILRYLTDFGGKRLGLVERGGVVYSEPVTFLSKLTTLTDQPLPLPDVGLADYLTTHDVTFGFNALEVRNASGKRRFGAVLTLKEYRELSTGSVDLLLQLPVEFMISQCLDFINQEKALAEYKEQKEIFDLSEETDLPESIGLTEMLASDHHLPVDFGEQQLTIFALGDSVKQMEENMRRISAGLSGLGILFVREDIKFQEMYWSLLPANFEFLRRLKPINTARIGGFAQVSNLPAGLAKGSVWGPPVTLLHTAANTPYFFNFHIQNNGHTAVIGPHGAGKTVLINFLLSEARKFKNRLFFFDRERSAEVFLRSIGADYYSIDMRQYQAGEEDPRPKTLTVPKLNPLQLDDTPQNRSFLLVWLDAMLRADKFYRPEMSDEFWPAFQQAVDYIYEQPKEHRQLALIVHHLRELNPKAATKLYAWYSDGEFAAWFNHTEDNLDLSGGIAGLELAPLFQQERAAAPVIAYLLHRVMLTLDGTPTIIVLDEAWELLDNPVFSARLGGWLEMLRSRNAMVILATEKPEAALQSRLSPTIMQQMATQFYLPNPSVMSDEYSDIFGLTTQECKLIAQMDKKDRQFLLKRGYESIVVEVNLYDLPTLLPVLSADPAALAILDKIMLERGTEPVQWLHLFIEKMGKA